MAKYQKANKTLKLSNVRLSYYRAHDKTSSVKDGPLKYRGNFLLGKKDADGKKNIALVEDAIAELMDKSWGRQIKLKEDRRPMFDGDLYEDDDGNIRLGYEGCMYVRASNVKKPKLRDRDGVTPIEEDDDKLLSGDYANVWINLYTVDDKDSGGPGIFASLEAVQFIKKGERFGGGGIDDDEITAVDGDDDDRSSRSRRRSEPDEEDRPSRSRRRDSDEEDERPSRPRRSEPDDDERPTRSRRRDADEEDERPSRSRRRDADEEDERPSRSRRRDEDEDERPARRNRDRGL